MFNSTVKVIDYVQRENEGISIKFSFLLTAYADIRTIYIIFLCLRFRIK